MGGKPCEHGEHTNPQTGYLGMVTNYKKIYLPCATSLQRAMSIAVFVKGVYIICMVIKGALSPFLRGAVDRTYNTAMCLHTDEAIETCR